MRLRKSRSPLPLQIVVGGGPGTGCSKKRRLAAPPAEEGAGTDRAPPRREVGGGDEGGGAGHHDRLSELPDGVLGDIVSLLPTKDGARTQVLASRWRHIWLSAPLNLDVGSDPKENLDHDAIRAILSAHPGPVRHLGISAEHAGSDETMDDWLRSPAFDDLQGIEFYAWLPPPVLPRPPAIFRFAATLRLAAIGTCRLDHQDLHFPQLKHLALDEVVVSERALHGLIAGCPALECLLLHRVSGPRCARINSLTLTSIGVLAVAADHFGGVPRFDQLVIEKAPLLQRLFRIDLTDGMQVSVISAPPWMETLCCIFLDYNHNACTNFDTIIQDLRAHCLATMVCTVKVLALKMSSFSLDMVLDLIRCFPCLDKLYLQNHLSRNALGSAPMNCWIRKHRNPSIRCLDTHLKKIVLESYQGTVSQVNFLTFFVLNARVLESMTIQVKTIDDEFITKHQRLLQVEEKASECAQFHFRTDRCLRDIGDISDVRDLDRTDPFLR